MARVAALAWACAAAGAGAQISGIQPGSSLPDASVGKFYSVTFTPVNPFGGLPVSWSITPGCLNDSGLTFSPLNEVSSSARIQGIPTRQGSFDCIVTASDAGNSSFQKSYHLDVVRACIRPRITSFPPPAVVPGVPYRYTVTAFGRPPPLRFTALGLPPGLAIDPATGVIAGTTVSGGSHPVTIIVSGCGRAAVQSFILVVGTAGVDLLLSNQPNPAFFGQSIAVNVNASGGQIVPTGNVLLCVIAAGQYCAAPVGAPPPETDPALIPSLFTAPLDANGNAAFTLTGLSIQNYVLQAYYGGDSGHGEARTDPVDQFVIKGALGPPAKVLKQNGGAAEPIPALSIPALSLLALGIAGIYAAQARRRARRR